MVVKLLLIFLFMICGCTQVDYDVPSSNEIACACGNEIWTMDTHGKNKKRLLWGGISGISEISWSPDGKKIIFVTGGKKFFSELKMIDLFEKKIKKVLEKEGVIYDISWSPNGEEIILGWKRGLYSFNINRQKLQKIVDNKLLEADSIGFFSLSPDGNNIVFQAYYKSEKPKVCMINLNEKKVKRLSDNPPKACEMIPVWSPDGNWIAFDELNPNNKKPKPYHPIVLINPNTKQRYEIPLLKGILPYDINFSPDGKKIILGTNKGIYTVDIDGKNLKKLTTPPSPYTIVVGVSWRPIVK